MQNKYQQFRISWWTHLVHRCTFMAFNFYNSLIFSKMCAILSFLWQFSKFSPNGQTFMILYLTLNRILGNTDKTLDLNFLCYQFFFVRVSNFPGKGRLRFFFPSLFCCHRNGQFRKVAAASPCLSLKRKEKVKISKFETKKENFCQGF